MKIVELKHFLMYFWFIIKISFFKKRLNCLIYLLRKLLNLSFSKIGIYVSLQYAENFSQLLYQVCVIDWGLKNGATFIMQSFL